MSRVVFRDVVKRINVNVDRHNTERLYYVGGEHIDSCELLVTKHGLIEGSTIGFKFHFGFEPGHILFMSRNPHLRKASMATFSGICSDSTYVVETRDENVLLQKYLLLEMQSDRFWEWAEANKSGGVNYLINYKTLDTYEFDLPSLAEQKVLAEKLWAAYEVKQSYLKMIAATEEMVKSQFIEMFGNSIKVSINDLVDTIWGSSPDSSSYNDKGEGVPFYQGKTEFGDLYIKSPVVYCSAPIKMAKKNSILMSVRAPVGAVNLAIQDCCIGRGLASITPKEGFATTMFVYYALKYQEEEISRLGTGSTFKAINKDSYAKIKMPDANIEEQLKFISIAHQSDKSISELRKSVDAIDKVIKSLINENL